MWTAMPARKPVRTGRESRSAIQPSRTSAGDRHQDADHQRQHRGELAVERRADRRERRQAAGEDRRDGRIGAGRQHPVRPEHGEADGGGHEGEEADLRREAASRAVAICSGMAMAASVSPAARSTPSRESPSPLQRPKDRPALFVRGLSHFEARLAPSGTVSNAGMRAMPCSPAPRFGAATTFPRGRGEGLTAAARSPRPPSPRSPRSSCGGQGRAAAPAWPTQSRRRR